MSKSESREKSVEHRMGQLADNQQPIPASVNQDGQSRLPQVQTMLPGLKRRSSPLAQPGKKTRRLVRKNCWAGGGGSGRENFIESARFSKPVSDIRENFYKQITDSIDNIQVPAAFLAGSVDQLISSGDYYPEKRLR